MLFLSKNIAADFLGELTLLRHPEPSVFMVGDTGKVLSDAGFIFFNNKISACGSLTHMGDNRTGTGDGYDEQVKIDLAKIPADVKKLVFAVTIHEAEAREQNFGTVRNSFMRVLTTIMAPKLRGLTSLKMHQRKRPWCLANCITTTMNGNSKL